MQQDRSDLDNPLYSHLIKEATLESERVRLTHGMLSELSSVPVGDSFCFSEPVRLLTICE